MRRLLKCVVRACLFANTSFKMKHMEEHIVESFKNELYVPPDFCAVVKICFFPSKSKKVSS